MTGYGAMNCVRENNYHIMLLADLFLGMQLILVFNRKLEKNVISVGKRQYNMQKIKSKCKDNPIEGF